ncbi:hypothetical protein ACQP2H_10530 [Micromonospora sp. CA-248260]|uniref:hypothetical protein n=1 Tax=Micromonospora sp. CA-248260 TaxID=3239962 RepID=UPI003D8AA6F7
MNISEVRQELANAVAVIPGFIGYGYAPDSITVPCFVPTEVELEVNQSFGGYDKATITCHVLVSAADDEFGQKLLDELLSRTGSRSVRAALNAAKGEPGDYALNGAADAFTITRIQGYRKYTFGETEKYFGAEIVIEVLGKNEGD